jgi:hypothetical protein
VAFCFSDYGEPPALSPVISCVALEFHFDFCLSDHGHDGDPRHLFLISVISVYQR